MRRTPSAFTLQTMGMLALAVFLSVTIYPFSADAIPSGIIGETFRAAIPGEYPIRDVPIPRPELLGPERSADPSLPTTPPPNPEVGDSWLWWLFYHYPMPPHFEQTMCTVRGKTDRGYVVVEDSQWGVNMFQNDVDLILERWENSSLGIHSDIGIYDINSLHFGEPPDELDEDPRIYIMWFDIGSAGDGFFFYFDEYLDGTFQGYRSNECETIYLNSAGSQSPSGDYMISVVAHEFEHMIHWKYDEDEVTWVDEGMAELAMWFYGRPDNISSFNSSPDNSLIQWDGNWADYIQTYLWSLYYYERYGGDAAVYSLVHEPLNSIPGYEAVLDSMGYEESFADIFADWAVANFLDDTSLADGRYGYLGEDLPSFSTSGTFESYPVLDQSRSVQHWATDYYRFDNLDSIATLQVGFDGSDDNVFAVWGLVLHDLLPTEVRRMALDPEEQNGMLEIGGLGNPEDEMILVVAGTSSSGSTGYLFNAEAYPIVGTDEERIKPWGSPLLTLSAGPNPSTGHVRLQLTWDQHEAATPHVSIYDIRGHLVRQLSLASSTRGTTLIWDGHDNGGRPLPAGVYCMRARVGSLVTDQNVVLLR